VHPSYDVGLFVRAAVVQQMRLVPSPAGEQACCVATALLCVPAADILFSLIYSY
jgi:hypothetical protein